MAIRVILVDDHAMVRDGVRYLLEAQPDIVVIGSFGEGAEAVRFAAAEQPDVAVVDIAMPGMNGIEAARRMHDACPQLQIVMLSMYAHSEYVYQSLCAGARGYLLKESAGSELVEAIREVHAGRRYLGRRIDHAQVERYLHERVAANPLERLSPREREVLRLTVEGKTIADAAELLGLSPKSIETYRARLMRKLDLEDLPSLVKFAIRHGITGVE